MTDADVISKMFAKSKDKLKTANIDFEHGQYDDAVSRAYYAVFHAISAALLSRKLHFSSHSQTIGAFNREFVKPGLVPADFSRIIQRLFNDRQTGDYDMQTGIDAESARENLLDAEKIILTCEKIAL
jgi:hypothetical protein